MPNINVKNQSNTRLLFSVFNQGDNGVPFEAKWIDANTAGNLGVGNLKSVGIGVQAQEGGRWIGGDPGNAPYASPGQTVTFTAAKAIA